MRVECNIHIQTVKISNDLRPETVHSHTYTALQCGLGVLLFP